MKIVNRETFLSLPKNTLFSKYEPCFFSEMEIKGETWGHDFLAQSIHDAVKSNSSEEYGEILIDRQADGKSFDMDFDCMGRDGMFEDSQLFVVWESKDIEMLIIRLQECLVKESTDE